jgi:hypothetical protein
VEGKQNKNTALVEQSRGMAAGCSRKFFNKELPELTALLNTGASGNALASLSGGASTAGSGGSGGGENVDGRYDCQMAALQFDGVSYVTQYRPTGMWFVIKGGSYSAQSGGGSVHQRRALGERARAPVRERLDAALEGRVDLGLGVLVETREHLFGRGVHRLDGHDAPPVALYTAWRIGPTAVLRST